MSKNFGLHEGDTLVEKGEVQMGGVALRGREGAWPLAGHFRGALTWSGTSLAVHWAGALASDQALEVAWSCSRRLDAALRKGVVRSEDRRAMLGSFWHAIERIRPDELGPRRGEDLQVLVLASDAKGKSLSSVGLGAIYALGVGNEAVPTCWLQRPHPLFVRPGIGEKRPGALSVRSVPEWLIGRPWDRTESGVGEDVGERLLAQCGVHI